MMWLPMKNSTHRARKSGECFCEYNEAHKLVLLNGNKIVCAFKPKEEKK